MTIAALRQSFTSLLGEPFQFSLRTIHVETKLVKEKKWIRVSSDLGDESNGKYFHIFPDKQAFNKRPIKTFHRHLA